MAHNVDIVDNDANWLHWGQLVDYWIHNNNMTRPQTVSQLNDALNNGNNPLHVVIQATVLGNPGRGVNIRDYPDDANPPPYNAPIQIWLPTLRMIANDINLLHGPGPYPLHSFYDMCYVSPVRRTNFTQSQLREIMLRRVGEYVINECM
jgi:hypothetical protein